MLYGAIDIHKAVFQAAVLDPESGELSERRFAATREGLGDWANEWRGKLAAVAIEATTGWRWVARELQQCGFEVRLVDPGRASALRGRRRKPKTDRLDARWLAMLLARQLLSECEAWLPPAEIQRLRDQTRLRKALAGERTGWAQRLHALLTQEGWPCARGRLLTAAGRRWVDALELDPYVRAQVEVMLTVMAGLEEQLELVESELRRFARADRRCQALETAPAFARTVSLGRSWQGRPIEAVEVGSPSGTPVLVVGCIHGNETGGIAIARARAPVATRA